MRIPSVGSATAAVGLLVGLLLVAGDFETVDALHHLLVKKGLKLLAPLAVVGGAAGAGAFAGALAAQHHKPDYHVTHVKKVHVHPVHHVDKYHHVHHHHVIEKHHGWHEDAGWDKGWDDGGWDSHGWHEDAGWW